MRGGASEQSAAKKDLATIELVTGLLTVLRLVGCGVRIRFAVALPSPVGQKYAPGSDITAQLLCRHTIFSCPYAREAPLPQLGGVDIMTNFVEDLTSKTMKLRRRWMPAVPRSCDVAIKVEKWAATPSPSGGQRPNHRIRMTKASSIPGSNTPFVDHS